MVETVTENFPPIAPSVSLKYSVPGTLALGALGAFGSNQKQQEEAAAAPDLFISVL